MVPLYDCIIKGTSFSEHGKRVFICGERNEQILFFKLDGCYIQNNSKKCDLLVIYSNSDYKFILIVELKGKNLYHAIEQFKETINNKRFRYIINVQNCKNCRNDKCIKIFLVVHSGGITLSNDLKESIYKNYGFFLETKNSNCDLKEIIKTYKSKYKRVLRRIHKK